MLDDLQVGEFTYYNLSADQAALESRNSWPLVDSVARTLEASGEVRAPRTDDFMRANPRRQRVAPHLRSPSGIDPPAAPIDRTDPKVEWPVLASGVLDWREPQRVAAAGGTEEKTEPGLTAAHSESHEKTPEPPPPESQEIDDSRRPRRDTE